MRVLCVDTGSNALDLLMRMQRFGHEVRWWQKDFDNRTTRRSGEGIIPLIRDFDELRKKWIGWADLIYLPDNSHYLDLLEPYRRIGYPIYGCNVEAAELELDREKGQKAMKECGIEIMQSKIFNDYDSAEAWVKKHPQYLVSKPSGDVDKAMSYVADDPGDMAFMLRKWRKVDKYVRMAKELGFVLQEKQYGCEMAVGGWFGPGGWSKWWLENFEYKKLMAGDMGPNTGEMGTLTRMVRKSKLAQEMLVPMTPVLERLGYVGFIDNNCIIDDKGHPWPMEFTMRDGWPLRHNLTAMLQNADPAQWMLDMINGKDTLQAIDGLCCISLVKPIPDFPYSKLLNKDVCGIPIYGDISDNVHLSEAMLGEAPTWIDGKVIDLPCPVTAGDYPVIITGTGDTITAARASAYATQKKIRIPNNPWVRPDIGRGKLVKNLPLIQKHGYATGLSF
jgi:phosphoribosylamine---glycine ligase